jgi:transcriptional regulator with XRE-family HTH domain
MLDATTRDELGGHQQVTVVLRALKQRVGLSERDVALVTGAQDRTVRRWLEGSASPRVDSAARIDSVRALVMVLGEMLDPPGITAWLRNRNPLLDFRRPLEVLKTDQGFDEVLGAAQELVSGTFV